VGACRIIEENLKKTGNGNGRVIQREVGAFLRSEKTSYDLIFADPPYADGLNDPARDLIAMEGWEQWLEQDGFLILEREAVGELPEPAGLSLLQSRDYGRSRIAIYQLEP
jgi:16S rRNA (guanine966-N2)-methyltransferase